MIRSRAYSRSRAVRVLAKLAPALLAFAPAVWAQTDLGARLAEYRNLGKAFYENPTTKTQAVDEFRRALSLAPNSDREQVNYGLALLASGETERGVLELEKAQKTNPKIPNSWF